MSILSISPYKFSVTFNFVKNIMLPAVAALSATVVSANEAPVTIEQALKQLSTHRQIRDQLHFLQQYSRGRLRAGPLIKNGDNGGLIDIDVALDATLPFDAGLCGSDGDEISVRDAVVCTVDDGIGNTDPENVGYSNQGREILAARIGNRHGATVLVITQQHGNEVAATEAALRVLKQLSLSQSRAARTIRSELDVLFILRANPDGGEPGPDCFIGPAPLGAPLGEDQDCGITRYNLDRSAGGGFVRNTEAGFFGVVGRGYDLNRYHFADLEGPIRPVETQAVVAAALALQPDAVLDLHGDVIKTVCAIDPLSVPLPNPLGLPLAECVPSPEGTETLGTSPVEQLVSFSPFSGHGDADGGPRRERARALMARVAARVEASGVGPVTRFVQPQIGVGAIGPGNATRAYGSALEALSSGWETRNMPPRVALAVLAVVNGAPVPGITIDTGFDPDYLETQIQTNRIALREALLNLARFERDDPVDDEGYCDIGLPTGLISTLPEPFFGPNPISDQPAVLPLVPGEPLGVLIPLFFLDACETNPGPGPG